MLEGKDHYRVLSAIKRTFSRSATAIAARNNAKYAKKKGPRGGARYKCKKCKKDFGARDVQVDHKNPCIPIGEKSIEMSWDKLVSQIYCDPSNLDVLCTECHKKKSKLENIARRAK
jgi:5-methylcytosine-specific restriction endonuclease McrA